MGRIEAGGESLIDLDEAAELLGKNRRTVFRLVKQHHLIVVPVAGDRKTYVTEESIKRTANQYKSRERISNRPTIQRAVSLADLHPTDIQSQARRAELQRIHPEAFPT